MNTYTLYINILIWVPPAANRTANIIILHPRNYWEVFKKTLSIFLEASRTVLSSELCKRNKCHIASLCLFVLVVTVTAFAERAQNAQRRACQRQGRGIDAEWHSASGGLPGEVLSQVGQTGEKKNGGNPLLHLSRCTLDHFSLNFPFTPNNWRMCF